MTGVLNVAPVPIGMPPVGAAYQFNTLPGLAVALSATDAEEAQDELGTVVNTCGLSTTTVATPVGEIPGTGTLAQ